MYEYFDDRLNDDGEVEWRNAAATCAELARAMPGHVAAVEENLVGLGDNIMGLMPRGSAAQVQEGELQELVDRWAAILVRCNEAHPYSRHGDLKGKKNLLFQALRSLTLAPASPQSFDRLVSVFGGFIERADKTSPEFVEVYRYFWRLMSFIACNSVDLSQRQRLCAQFRTEVGKVLREAYARRRKPVVPEIPCRYDIHGINGQEMSHVLRGECFLRRPQSGLFAELRIGDAVRFHADEGGACAGSIVTRITQIEEEAPETGSGPRSYAYLRSRALRAPLLRISFEVVN